MDNCDPVEATNVFVDGRILWLNTEDGHRPVKTVYSPNLSFQKQSSLQYLSYIIEHPIEERCCFCDKVWVEHHHIGCSGSWR
jgi:hypothetical protein